MSDMQGALLGGLLAFPAQSLPYFVSPGSLLDRLPVLLPSIVFGLLSLVAFILTLWLEETLPDAPAWAQPRTWFGCTSFRHKVVETPGIIPLLTSEAVSYETFDTEKQEENEGGQATVNLEDSTSSLTGLLTQPPREQKTNNLITDVIDLLSQGAPVVGPLIAFLCYMVTTTATDELIPLWCSYSQSAGGLGMNITQVSVVLITGGVIMLFMSAFVIPKIIDRFGPINTYMWTTGLLSIFPLCFPFLHNLQCPTWTGCQGEDEPLSIPIWVVMMALTVLRGMVGPIGFTCCMIMGNNTTLKHLGLLNGIYASILAASRMLVPVVTSSVLAWSLIPTHSFPFDYHFMWLVCVVALVGSACIGAVIPQSANARKKLRRRRRRRHFRKGAVSV